MKCLGQSVTDIWMTVGSTDWWCNNAASKHSYWFTKRFFLLLHLVITGVLWASSLPTVQFIKKCKLQAMGVWRGSIQTLSDVKSVSTNFYRLLFDTSKGKRSILCLETSSLGTYFAVNYKINVKFSSHYGVNPTIYCVCLQPKSKSCLGWTTKNSLWTK